MYNNVYHSLCEYSILIGRMVCIKTLLSTASIIHIRKVDVDNRNWVSWETCTRKKKRALKCFRRKERVSWKKNTHNARRLYLPSTLPFNLKLASSCTSKHSARRDTRQSKTAILPSIFNCHQLCKKEAPAIITVTCTARKHIPVRAGVIMRHFTEK